MRQWQLQEAKARLSELVRRALREGPQEVTLHGEPKVVVVAGTELDFERDPSPPRDLAL